MTAMTCADGCGQAHRRPDRAQGSRVQPAFRPASLVIERTMSWLTGYRRLTIRYERYSGNYLAFLGLAAALCCYEFIGCVQSTVYLDLD
ncbi:hypothetical protein [Nonomuraea pusilla]|nr:hypothetical protein [Nonomuraea pusilla]